MRSYQIIRKIVLLRLVFRWQDGHGWLKRDFGIWFFTFDEDVLFFAKQVDFSYILAGIGENVDDIQDGFISALTVNVFALFGMFLHNLNELQFRPSVVVALLFQKICVF